MLDTVVEEIVVLHMLVEEVPGILLLTTVLLMRVVFRSVIVMVIAVLILAVLILAVLSGDLLRRGREVRGDHGIKGSCRGHSRGLRRSLLLRICRSGSW